VAHELSGDPNTSRILTYLIDVVEKKTNTIFLQKLLLNYLPHNG
jgi:hypothetical protein